MQDVERVSNLHLLRAAHAELEDLLHTANAEGPRVEAFLTFAQRYHERALSTLLRAAAKFTQAIAEEIAKLNSSEMKETLNLAESDLDGPAQSKLMELASSANGSRQFYLHKVLENFGEVEHVY